MNGDDNLNETDGGGGGGGFNWGGTLGNLLDTGLGAFKATRKTPRPAPKPLVTTKPMPTWVMPAAIGGGVLVVLLVVLAFFKKGK